MKISMTTCDRCGEQIRSNPVHILICGRKNIAKQYQDLFHQKDFCKECIEEITAFALNKDACDECMREMEENAALLRVVDGEMRSNDQRKKDPAGIFCGIDRGVGFGSQCIIPVEEVAMAMRDIRKNHQGQSGKQVIPAEPIDQELFLKY